MDEEKLSNAIASPKNLGEMADADAVGTVGNPDCGDMVRMWLKFSEKDGRKVIDRASFQSFGCQTAIAVASMATEMLAGKSVEEARNLSAEEMTGDLGPLPPVKIHCGQMVEGALRAALEASENDRAAKPGDAAEGDGGAPGPARDAGSLAASLSESAGPKPRRIRIVPADD